MTLALRLGRTVDELTQTLTASELKMWMAFDALSPIGDCRDDILAAMIASSTLNAQGAQVSVSDMMPMWSPEPNAEREIDKLEAFFEGLAE